MFIKLMLCTFLLLSFSNAITTKEGALYKEKQELLAVKDELNEFYEIKELEYQKNKVELEKLQKNIKESENNIMDIKESNQKILDEINRVITSKAMVMYDKMKLGTVINVFNEMIANGEIDEVFDIMMRMKEKRVMKILKKFDTKIATVLMKKMRINKEINTK
jgi:flagellar motility protein MotE (MotC chaperone)